MPFVPDWASKKPKKAKKIPRKEVAGPYLDQSSKRKYRERATPREHRKVPVGDGERKRLRKAARKVPVIHAGTKKVGDPVGPVLERLKDTYDAVARNQPGADIARDVVKDEAKNLIEATKESYEDEIKGTAHLKPLPSKKQAQAAVTIASLASAGPAASQAEKALAKAATAAADAPAAVKAGAKAAPRAAAARTASKARRIASAPRRAARTAKRAPELKTKAGQKAAAKASGRKAAQHPLASFGGAGVVANQSGADIPGLREAGAFVEGHVDALKDNPKKTLETTARAVPGIVTGPAALLGSAGSSVVHGTPQPLLDEAKKQGKGLVQMGESLLSGDPKKVQKTVEDEAGLSVVAPLPALSRVTKTKVYKSSRGKVRGKVAAKREATRAERRQELREVKAGSRKKAKKIRHAVIDTATGEERVLRRTGKVLEGHRQRKAVSRSTARQKAQGEREALLASKDVIKHIRKSKFAKGDHNIGDVLATVAQYGISRKSEKASRQLDEIEASIGKVDPDEIPAGTITDLSNIQWLREHPEALKDREFWKAVDAYKRQAKEIETSKRKKVLAVGDVYGIARPEERLEAGVKVGGRTVRAHFYKDDAAIQRKQAELAELRHDAQANERLARSAAPESRQKHAAIANEIYGRSKALERELKDYRAGFKQAQKDYVREAQATIREKGLEQPAYVKDVKPREPGEVLPAFSGGKSSRKQHMARAEQARRGSVMARDFETLVNQSIAEPRLRRQIHEATTQFVDEWSVPVGGKRYVTSDEFSRAVNRGELDPSQYAKLHSQFFKQAVLDPHKSGDALATELREALSGEVRGRANDPGNKYVVVPREALQEFVHQMEPPKGIDRLFGGANRLLTRAILGYSPAWAVAQLVAEGIPASFAIGANPARWARVAKYLAKEDKQLSRKDRAAIDGMVGESAGVTPHPQIQFKPDTNLQASRFLRLSSRNRVGRALLKGASGEALSVLDRWKGGKYRKAVAAAKVDRELNGFVKSLGELMKGQRSIVEAIKGKPLAEQMAYIAKHPKEAAKLESYLDDVMGNWRALTRHEAKVAPLVVFYPFVRYSLRWMFWSFPKEHPVKASILYFLAQQNANELEKLIGGKPQNWIDYAVPVYSSAKDGQGVLPGGTRIAPGTNALATAIGSGKVEALASGLNPALGIAGAAVYGVDSFTGEKVADTPGQHALLALNALLSLPAPIRLAKLNKLGEGEQSASSKVYEGTDPNRATRSFAFPFLPNSGERYSEAQRFSRDQGTKYSDPISSIFDNPEVGEAIFGEDGKTVNWPLVKRLTREHKLSEKASDRVTAAERPFFDSEGGDMTDEQLKALHMLQGGILVKPPKPKPNPFGLPDMDSDALREQFGLPATSSADLRKQFGIE